MSDLRQLFAACCAVWEGCTPLTFDELLVVGDDRLLRLAELLGALTDRPAALDDRHRDRSRK